MKPKIFILLVFLMLPAPGSRASDQVPAPPQDHPVALAGGTIHPLSGPAIEDATIVFVAGKISAIGQRIDLPEGCEQIDISGKHVYPGLIAANTRLGLMEIRAVRATLDYEEVGDLKPNVRAEVSINPDSELLPVTRANGITLAHTIPMGGLISGTSAVIMLDGWTWEEMTLKAPAGLYIDWPSMTISPGKDAEKQRKTRDEALQKIRDIFADARAYWKARQAQAQQGIPYHDSDVRLEALIPVLKKEVPVLLHAREIRQFQAAIDWVLQEDLDPIVVGGDDLWRAIDLLKKHNIPVILEGTHVEPYRRWEPYDTPFSLALKLYQAGVRFCIAGEGTPFSTPSERNLPYQAATAAAYGLPAEEALKSVTLYPAQILGIDDRVGSLDVGKDATLIVTNGDPLEIMTRVEMEFIRGRKVDLSNRHTRLYQKYKAKYQQLGLIGE